MSLEHPAPRRVIALGPERFSVFTSVPRPAVAYAGVGYLIMQIPDPPFPPGAPPPPPFPVFDAPFAPAPGDPPTPDPPAAYVTGIPVKMLIRPTPPVGTPPTQPAPPPPPPGEELFLLAPAQPYPFPPVSFPPTEVALPPVPPDAADPPPLPPSPPLLLPLTLYPAPAPPPTAMSVPNIEDAPGNALLGSWVVPPFSTFPITTEYVPGLTSKFENSTILPAPPPPA
jgi:hypothetical protein